MKTNIIANNPIINTIMRNVFNYICAVLLLIGTSASAWAGNCTYYVWNGSSYVAYITQDQSKTVPEGPVASGSPAWGNVPHFWSTTTDAAAYASAFSESDYDVVRFYPNDPTSDKPKNTGQGVTALYAVYGTYGNWSATLVPDYITGTSYTITMAVSPAGRGTATVDGVTSLTVTANDYPDIYAVATSGYMFKEWQTSNPSKTLFADEYAYVTDVNVEANVTITAVFEVPKTITFNKNGGSGSMDDQKVIKNRATTLNTCTFTPPSGKRFGGWAEAPATDIVYADGGTISTNTDVTLYAKWIDNTKYSVIYELEGVTKTSGPTEISTSTTSFTATFSFISGYSNPVEAHFIFDGWDYSTSDPTSGLSYSAGTLSYTSYDNISGNVRVIVTATEDPCTMPTVAFSSGVNHTVDYGASGWTDAATVTSGGTPTGQTISYGSTNNDVASVNSSGVVTIGTKAGTTTISATADEKGDYCEASASYTVTVNAIAPTLSHNTSGKELTTSSITSSSVSVAGGIITNKGGANITNYGFVIGTSADVTYATATKKGGWNGDKSLNSAFSSAEFTGLTPNTDYYVRAFAYNGTAYGYSTAITFKTLQRYTITYDKNDGSSTTSTVNVDAGGSITVGNGISWTRTGYTLSNWRLNNASSGTEYATDATYSSVSANATFYAQWTVNIFSVRFNKNADDATGTMSNQAFTYGVAQNLTTNAFSRTGYTFAGWATSENGSIAYTDEENVSNLSSTNGAVVDLYAKWTANEIELVLSANGGEDDGSATVVYDATGLKGGTLVHATYAGHTLEGYYDDADHTTKVLNSDGSFAATNVTGYITSGKWSRTTDPTTLYAFWAANPQTVTFDLDGKGDNFTRVVDNGTPVARPADPTHIDYNFDDWYTDDGEGNPTNMKYNFSTNVTADITIHAKWTAKEYENLIFACVDLGLVTEDGAPALITSRNGINVMATKKLKVTVSGALSGHAVKLEGSDTDLKFYKNDGTRFIELTNADAAHTLVAPLDQQEVYVSYAPSDAGTNGAISSKNVTIKCDGFEETASGIVKVRNLPNAVAIVAKVGNTYQALPANIASASNPAPVMVSVTVADGVNKASGPSTVSYKLWSAASLNSTTNNDRWGTSTASTPGALYGDRLRFAGNSNKALWANNSLTKNTISDGTGAIDEIGDYFDNDAAYEWIVTTTEVDGQFVYTLTTDQSQNTNTLRLWGSKWGTYGSSYGIAEVYILPLIETATADVTVMEWGTDQIAVKYENAGTVASGTFKARIGAADQTTVTCTSLGGDIYKLTGVGALQDNPAKTLTLNMTETSTPKQAVFAIPLIVTASKTEAQLSSYAAGGDGSTLITEGRAIAKGMDVVIRSGGTLTTGTAQGKFANLFIYPGGKAEITNNIGFGNIYLRGGFSWLDAEKDYRLPQMKVDDDITIDGVQQDGNGIYYDLYLDKRRYYMMAVPKDVSLESMTNEEGGDDATIWLKQYSGRGRTLTPKTSGWVTISTPKLLRGVGYEMSIKPRSAGAMNGRTIGILRMPLLQGTAWTNEGECTPAVKAWGFNDDNVTANNKGWNFIGNPFFTAFRNTDANGQFGGNMEIRDLVEHKPDGVNWDGTWDWTTSEAVKYITIPQKMYDDYEDVRAKNYEIDAFYPFFIQAKLDGSLTFTGSPVLKAPSILRAKIKEREVMIDFMLTDANGTSDQAGLTVGNEYSADFDMEDKEKTIVNENYLKVYTMVGEYRTAFNSLPEAVAELPIPVGYIAPKQGTYYFSTIEGDDYSKVKHLWLTDYETSRTVDLLDETYEFQTTGGENNARFVLNVILNPENEENTTGLGDIQNENDGPTKFIYEDKMFIKQNGVIYDATGKKVREINK